MSISFISYRYLISIIIIYLIRTILHVVILLKYIRQIILIAFVNIMFKVGIAFVNLFVHIIKCR